MKSFPFSVSEYSHFIGNSVESIFFVINPFFSSFFNRADKTFVVLSGSRLFISEYLIFFNFPLYSSNRINNVHFFTLPFFLESLNLFEAQPADQLCTGVCVSLNI